MYGILAASLAAIITQPADVIKTRLMVKKSANLSQNNTILSHAPIIREAITILKGVNILISLGLMQ